jgi:hypothetical protein
MGELYSSPATVGQLQTQSIIINIDSNNRDKHAGEDGPESAAPCPALGATSRDWHVIGPMGTGPTFIRPSRTRAVVSGREPHPQPGRISHTVGQTVSSIALFLSFCLAAFASVIPARRLRALPRRVPAFPMTPL